MILTRRFMRAAAWRVIWPTRVLILRAGPRAQAPPAPAGFWPVRVSASSMSESIVHRVTESMWRAGEACAEVAARLAHGDECFAWQSEHGIASFGWVTYRDRVVGPVKLLNADKRAFLYNFYTAPEFRGRGLYPTLLLYVRHVLAGDGKTDMIIDVNVRNDRSLRGIGKAGFTPVARITYLTLFRRYNWTLGRAILSQSDTLLA